MTTTLLTCAAAMFTAMTLLWLASLVRRDASIVDLFWGPGFVLVATLAATLRDEPSPRVRLLTLLVAAWGLRLALYLAWRNWGRGEDRRYAAMRSRRGASFWWWSLPAIFWLQGAILWWVSLPLQVAAVRDVATPWTWLDAAGLALWGVGWCFETVGDWQLARFQAQPENAGRVMDRGLWRYTRHPNYFGDFCVWWGLFLIAVAGGAAATVGSPLAMSWLLRRFSGVPLLERSLRARRPDYAAYAARTNAFFPGPPRRS